MNIVLTGSEGFIGRNLLQYLQRAGHRVFGLDLEDPGIGRCDLSDPEQMVDWAERNLLYHRPKERVEVHGVVHLAAMGSIRRCAENQERAWECNVMAFENMLGLSRLARCKAIVYASSSSVYAGSSSTAIDQVRPLSFYASTKLVNEQMAKAAWMGWGIHSVGLRLFNVIGPGQKKNGSYSALVPLILQAIRTQEPIPLYNGGMNTRSFTPVKTVCSAILALLSGPMQGPEIYNLGSFKSVSVRDLVQLFQAASGKTVPTYSAPARDWEAEGSRCVSGPFDGMDDFHATLEETVMDILKDENLG